MSQCIVPNWNLNHQRQEQREVDQERNRSSLHPHSHVHSDHNLTYVVPMDNYEVTELTWENGQLALHGLGGMDNQTKQTPTSTTTTTTTWEKPGDHTLESIVHQATFPSYHQNIQAKMGGISTAQMHIDQNQEGNGNLIRSSAGKWSYGNSDQVGDFEQNLESMGSMAASASSTGKWRGNLDHGEGGGGLEIVEEKRVPKLGENPGLVNKRIKMTRSGFQAPDERTAASASACASASATFCRDQPNTTMMTWNSLESPMSLKSGRMNGDDDSACLLSNSENQEGERMNKGERRRSRAAAIHNQSERRRRDRINEKMRALQKLVPNASKTDKASMLDEVIEYLKQLQAQVQMMSSARNMPMSQMMMPLGMQQQQMSSLLAARMGMGIGMGMGMGVGGVPAGMPMGMFDVNTMARNVPQSMPSIIHGGGSTALSSSFVSPSPFAMAPMVPNHGHQLIRPDHHASVSNLTDAYSSFLAQQQSMNMDFFNKMAAIYRQQATHHQKSKTPVTSSQLNNGQAQ